MHPDEVLLRRFLSQEDELAFDRLIQRHCGMVLHMCQRILGNPQDAEDAAQSTFMVLHKKAAELSKGGNVAPWLRHVATCIARDIRRSRQARKCREEAMANERNAGPRETGEAYEDLYEAIGRLPQRRQQAIVCFYLQGATLQEIAADMGCSENTVKLLLHRGRQGLRDELRQRGSGVSTAALCSMLAVPHPVELPESLSGHAIRERAQSAPADATLEAYAREANRELKQGLPTGAFLFLAGVALAGVGWGAFALLDGPEIGSTITMPHTPEAIRPDWRVEAVVGAPTIERRGTHRIPAVGEMLRPSTETPSGRPSVFQLFVAGSYAAAASQVASS